MTAWLIDTVLYTGLLIGLVLAVRRPVARWFGPQIAYALWALPFMRLLLPPIVLPASFAPQPPSLPATAATGAGSPLEMPVAPAAALAPVPSWEWADLIAPAVSAWAGVALAFLAWRVVAYRRMRRELLRGARPVGEIGRIRLVETPALAAPVAFGVLDQVIALPPQFMAQHDIAARDLAIAHELAHHRGHDLLANMAAQALLALHWCNPLAWLGWRAMRRDQEAACDARVLAGKGREERARYAALIAGTAAGPRALEFKGALAAPMACPVLGDKSIIHRLRSLSMSETPPRRRWMGRGLIAAGALALPLTASISYAASTQVAEPPVPPAPRAPEAPASPLPPEAPEAPIAPEVGEAQVRHVIARRTVDDAGGGGELPAPPQFDGQVHPLSPEFQAEMEQFEREMEKFGEEWAKNGHEWEKFGQEMARFGEERRAHAVAYAQQARRNAPQVVNSCDNDDARRTTTVNGRPRIAVCQREIMRARAGLRTARESIARNREISEEVRREVLRELDQEIERIERED